ncbi:hypothetical protein BV20DRAFT_535033 [Pilatotrama ljubarskyi]|nr:hypothetical protein BV20DRAFT_535033 [Pilatotrama ljubarskyi]
MHCPASLKPDSGLYSMLVHGGPELGSVDDASSVLSRASPVSSPNPGAGSRRLLVRVGSGPQNPRPRRCSSPCSSSRPPPACCCCLLRYKAAGRTRLLLACPCTNPTASSAMLGGRIRDQVSGRTIRSGMLRGAYLFYSLLRRAAEPDVAGVGALPHACVGPPPAVHPSK